MTETNTSGRADDIRDLQARAAKIAEEISARPTRSMSRAAELHLIDALSRQGGAGLGLLAGAAVFLAVTAGRNLPLRAAVWGAMVFAGIYLSRRLRRDFRVGDRISGRPFRWRADYTASLVGLSAAFGAGVWLLFPAGAAPDPFIVALAPAALAAAAATHAAHPRSIAALAIPGLAIASVGLFRNTGVSLAFMTIVAGAISVVAAGGLLSAHMQLAAAARFPRTRRNRDSLDALAPAALGDATDRSSRRNLAF